jgi:23S rRNA pseudouridine955/2504/2580 synthase
MAISSHYLIVNKEFSNQRLDNFLLARLKGVPKSCVYRLLRQGKIRVNRSRKKPSYRVQSEDSIYLPHLHITQPSEATPALSLDIKNLLLNSILFENETLLILNKPCGLAVHGGSGIRLGIIEALRQIYPNIKALELAHRLDRDTSGCLIIAKKASSLKSLHALFRTNQIKKTYSVLVKGQWPFTTNNKINAPLKKNQLKSGERMVKIHPEGKPALTEFILQQQFTHTSLVEAIPHTGRTHQIRVHAQHIHHPIAGDEKYGDKNLNQFLRKQGLKRLFLHAAKVSFPFPTAQEIITVEAPLPFELQKLLKQDI